MVTIQSALARVKDDVRQLFPAEAIVRICQSIGHDYRQRTLGPVDTVYAFLLQVLHGNTACSHLPHLLGQCFTDAAYCQARARLPLELFKRLLRWGCRAIRQGTETFGCWHGHRLFHIDGSSFSMSDTPELQAHFGQPGGQRRGCGFPVAHLLVMFDAATGFLLDVLNFPLRTHDISQTPQMHPRLHAGDVLVGDRAFCSYAHMGLLLRRKLHGVFRLRQKIISRLAPHQSQLRCRKHKSKCKPMGRTIRRLGPDDEIVEWSKPKQRPSWMTEENFRRLPDVLTLRQLRYRVKTSGCRTREVTLVTTLLDPDAYPKEELAEVFGDRWHVETNLRHLKITMGMDVLHCKTVQGVQKELMMFALVYNLVRCIMLEAGRRQGVSPNRISFADAKRWLATYQPGRILCPLKVNPFRPGRFEPRVRKRRPKQYPVMRRPRNELRNLLETQNVIT